MFVGLDVHKEFCQGAFVNAKGKIVREAVFENTQDGLQKLVKATKGSKVVLEASSSSLRVYDALCKTCHIKVAHPARVKAIASARIKTDKIDARILAQLLRADLIPESFVPSHEYRQARLLVRQRVAIVHLRTRVKNHIRSLMLREGIRIPYENAFSKKGMRFLKGMELDEMQRVSLDMLLSLLETLNAKVCEADERIALVAGQDKYAKLLVTIPGVSWFSALLISSEICDISRFPTCKHLCSYAGIVPSVYQSGSTDRKGRITKQGSRLMRWILVQDARSAVKRSRRFEKNYRRLSKRIGEKKAIIAIARKLCVSMYFMLVRNEAYREESKGGIPVVFRGHKDRSCRLGSSPPHDLTPCAASTNRRMS